MSKDKRSQLRAIDLYAGVGGWSLGLNMAGIDVVASYEWWKKAARTNEKNNGHQAVDIDIRTLKLEDLPSDIDIVVGSPPCTQFSFANRGGNGDIEDGLKDIAKFLEIVDHLKPAFWAMENVPRVASIVEERMATGGSLAQYRHLEPEISVVDMAEWGVPQRRKRCIIGNFDHRLLRSYRNYIKPRTLGNVIESLSSARVKDPIYDFRVSQSKVWDHDMEDILSPEEERINRENKTYHPIYNNMEFPDLLNRPGRTITATCTRVSRESIVIESSPNAGTFRRLSVRERASLQGFPISYQFYGDSYAEKLKMIGNAVPPLFTFFLAQAILNTNGPDLVSPGEGYTAFVPPRIRPTFTRPDKAGQLYPLTRKFRSAIPHLRFKSGVRFELANRFVDESIEWAVGFFFGQSKNIQRIELNKELLQRLLEDVDIDTASLEAYLAQLEFEICSTNAADLQETWARKAKSAITPYFLVDKLGEITILIARQLEEGPSVRIVKHLLATLNDPPGTDKLIKNAIKVLAGFIVGSAANVYFESDLFNRRKARFQSAG